MYPNFSQYWFNKGQLKGHILPNSYTNISLDTKLTAHKLGIRQFHPSNLNSNLLAEKYYFVFLRAVYFIFVTLFNIYHVLKLTLVSI